MPIFPTDRTHVGFQASSLPYLRRLQVWVYPLVILEYAYSAEFYRSFRANFTYDVIPIALFQAQIYVTLATLV